MVLYFLISFLKERIFFPDEFITPQNYINKKMNQIILELLK